MQTRLIFCEKAVLVIWAGLMGCGPGITPNTPTKTAKSSEEPTVEYESYRPLETLLRNADLPFWVNGEGKASSARCFEPSRKPRTWQTANSAIVNEMNRHADETDRVVIDWLRNEVLKEVSVGVGLDGLTFAYEKPTVAHVPLDKLAFDPEETCLSRADRGLPQGASVVATLFGAKALAVESRRPVSREKVMEMKRAAAKHGVRLVPDNAFTPAVDADGQPVRDEKKRRLFNSPSGKLIQKKEVPPPNRRPVVSWRFVMTKPVYFAYGTVPVKVWGNTPLPPDCQVFLVYDDAVPQVPDCVSFNAAGFGATRSETAGHVTIRIATDETTATKTLPLGVPSRVVVADHLVVWITPRPVEEGARLEIEGVWRDMGKPTPVIKEFRSGNARKRGRKEPRERQPSSSPSRPVGPPPVGY